MRSCSYIGLSGICLQGTLRPKMFSRSEWLSLDDDDRKKILLNFCFIL